MKVFVSWSGERSQALAQALRDWLPLVLYFVEPWLSQSDIEPGERWASEVSKELNSSNFGIICVTRENTESPWILFEAGALAKSMQQGRVIPLLFDVEFKDITGPLAQFQAKKVDKQGLNELVGSVNRLSEHAVPETRMAQLFEMAWPTLEAKFSAIPTGAPTARHKRPNHEILEELVAGVRNLELRFREALDDGPRSRRRRSMLHPMMMDEMVHGLRLDRRDPMRFLLLASMLRDSLPWIYELGVDAYRASVDGDKERESDAVSRFFQAIRLLRRGPFLEEFGLDKSTYMMVREMERMLLREADAAEEVPAGDEKRSASEGA